MSTQLPDSNGFWRDINDNIWAYDGNTSNPPILIYDSTQQRLSDNYNNTWAALKCFAPFTKINNPFTTGNNHASR